MLLEENNTSCGSLSSETKNTSLSFNINKVIKLIFFNSQVISTCELVNRDIKKIIFSSNTNDVNQNVLQVCLKLASKFLFQSIFDTAFFELFRKFLKCFFKFKLAQFGQLLVKLQKLYVKI